MKSVRCAALLTIALTMMLSACKSRPDSGNEAPLSSPLQPWNGTLTELGPDRPAGWIFANVDSLRTDPDIGALLEDMDSATTDPLARAVADASQIYVVWTRYTDDSRFSIVRTAVPAREVLEGMRSNKADLTLREVVGDNGLPLWVDDDGWAVAAPAENLIFAGPRTNIEHAAGLLLVEEGTDQLRDVEGFAFALDVSESVKMELFERLDNRTAQRAMAPIQRVEGHATFAPGLDIDGRIVVDQDGSPGLLATILRIGWERMAPDALLDWFTGPYVERLVDGMTIEAGPAGSNAVAFRYRLPVLDTRAWLGALTGDQIPNDGSAATNREDTGLSGADDSAASPEAPTGAIEDSKQNEAGADASPPPESDRPSAADSTAEPTTPTPTEPTTPRASPPPPTSQPAAPRQDAPPAEDAPTMLPP